MISREKDEHTREVIEAPEIERFNDNCESVPSVALLKKEIEYQRAAIVAS